jgi:AcrR family transcriptional regulator
VPEQQRAIRTRRAILEAAATVFDEQGYDAASLAEILTRARVTKGAMYFHFSSKEALAEAVMLEPSRGLPAPHPSSHLQTLIDLVHHAGHEVRKTTMMRASIRLTLEQGTFRSHGAAAYLAWIDAFQAHLQQADAYGHLLPQVSPRETAEFIVATFTGIHLVSEELSGHEDLPQRITTVWRYLLPRIATPATLSRLRLTEAVPAHS